MSSHWGFDLRFCSVVCEGMGVLQRVSKIRGQRGRIVLEKDFVHHGAVPMTSAIAILKHFPTVRKPQTNFLAQMLLAWSACLGRRNALNLHRHGAPHPRTQARWYDRSFDFSSFNTKLIEKEGQPQDEWIVAIDATFVKKSGKETCGLNQFWNGSRHCVEKGLEASVMAFVNVTENKCYALHVEQTLRCEEKTSVELFADQISRNVKSIQSKTKYVVGDTYYSNETIINQCKKLGLHFVGKCRKDIQIFDLPPERKIGQRGRPKKYGESLPINQFKIWGQKIKEEESIEIYSKIVISKSWDSLIHLVVCYDKTKDSKKLFFSTDLNLKEEKIIKYYRARFQVEFLIRDAKQHAGFQDAQMRENEGLEFHWNMSMLVLNIYKTETDQFGKTYFSAESCKKKCYNKMILIRFSRHLGLDLDCPKIRSYIDSNIEYGLRAA
jgi:hypothetical protein